MLRFATKQELWKAEDKGVGRLVRGSSLRTLMGRGRPYDLKTIQDTLCVNWLKDRTDQSIAEIGGGHSRVLKYLASRNRCTNIDPLKGDGLGPKKAKTIRNVQNVLASLGDFSDKLTDDEFDVTFSISVIEHVATKQLDDFFKDCARITKRGGLTIHFVDVYLGDTPDINVPTSKRIQRVKTSFANYFVPLDTNQTIGDDLQFSCDYATNPDFAMNQWNKMSPKLEDRRRKAQVCSLIMAGAPQH